MKKLSLLVLVLMMSAVNAFAVSLEFSFDVNSSGPSIYPCDAGLKHATHPQRVCYDRVTADSCNPAACSPQAECNCVCTGGATGSDGEYRMDFMNVSYTPWTENGSVAGASVSKTFAAQADVFSRVFPAPLNNKLEWDNQITALSFNLGSERYGAEFYLDVCYRGPQIEYNHYYQIGTGDAPNFSIKGQATVTDLARNTNDIKYSQVSGLTVKAQWVCDLQGQGTYKFAHNGTSFNSGSYDSTLNDITNNMSGDKVGVTAAAASFASGANLLLINDWITNNNSTTTPRFCKIRYTFLESVRNNANTPATATQGNLLAQIRKWKLHSARICTYTEISEAEVQ